MRVVRLGGGESRTGGGESRTGGAPQPDSMADSEEPLRPGACSRELELREFRDRYVIRSLDGGAAFAVARSGGCIRPLSPGQPLNG